MLVETYHKFKNDGQSIRDQEFDTINMSDLKGESGPMKPEDIAKRA